MSKRALCFGILGQDGMYMAELLHSKGYLVYGIVKPGTKSERLEEIKQLVPGIIIYKTDITNTEDLAVVLSTAMPDEVYNFAAVSDVIDPYHNIGLTLEINATVPKYIMSLLVNINPSAKYFQASSRLVFGSNRGGTLNELSAKNPTIPYGAAKLSADMAVDQFRKAGLFACSGIFFNHESERRPERFFTRKLSKGIAEILSGMADGVTFGNLVSFRDMGYAPEYVEAAWMMLQNEAPRDYIIGTGNVISMESYAEMAFSLYGLDTRKIIQTGDDRPYEEPQRANISKIKDELGWEPKTTYPEIIKKMVDYDISLLQKQTA